MNFISKPLRILVTGSSGFIGRALVSKLKAEHHQVVCLKRKISNQVDHAQIDWDPARGRVNKEFFEGFDALVHLAGESISGGRWTKKRKEKLFLSRCRDTWLLSQILVRVHRPPRVAISASAVGFYGDRGDEVLTEESPKGDGFLADLCEKWEEATLALEKRGCRVVHSRFGLVLSAQGGILKKLLPFYRLGLGGKIGSGEQMLSWISLEDAIRAIEYLLVNEHLHGPFNLVSPEPVTQKDFAKTLAKSLHRPLLFPMPKPLVEFLFGEMGKEVFLASQHVKPYRLLESGFHFNIPHLKDALESFF